MGPPRRLLRLVPRRTVRLRLTLLYGSLFLASGVLLLGVTYFLVRHDITGTFVSKGKNGEITAVFGGDTAHVPIGVATISQGQIHAAQGGVGVNAGTPLSGTSSGGQVVRVPVPGVAQGKVPSPQQVREQLTLLHNEAVRQQNLELHQLLLDSGFALIGAALLSIALGWLVAGRVLRPLRTITSKAQAISSTNLHERIGLTGPRDEVRTLGDTFDALLERLEHAFDAQRQFVANASHELRTPLARQRAVLEVASADPQADVRSLRTASARAISASEEQEQLIEALLTLASSERGLDERVPFDLAVAVQSVIASKAAEATIRGMRVDSDFGPAPTSGNERLARRLTANLVDNALHYNVEDGWIAVSTTTEGADAVLRVSNSGPAIPEADVERLFRPFERMSRGRTVGEGHGLGLSIVKAIAEAHGGTVAATASPGGGLDVEVRLPLAAAVGPEPGRGATEAQPRRRAHSETRP